MKTIQAENLTMMMKAMMNCKGPVGVKLARNFRMINDELIEYREERIKLFKKYGKQEGDKLRVEEDSENYPLFLQESKALDEMEIEFNFRTISEDELKDSGLTAQQMLVLMDSGMIVEKEND